MHYIITLQIKILQKKKNEIKKLRTPYKKIQNLTINQKGKKNRNYFLWVTIKN
jgi:hypothetical protein